MNPKKTYICDRCEQLHDNKDRALECCPPEISTGWTCANCDEFHHDLEDAEKCCASVASETCPTCARTVKFPMDAEQIQTTGTCSTCRPILTVEQKYQIDRLHEHNTTNNAAYFCI